MQPTRTAAPAGRPPATPPAPAYAIGVCSGARTSARDSARPLWPELARGSPGVRFGSQRARAQLATTGFGRSPSPDQRDLRSPKQRLAVGRPFYLPSALAFHCANICFVCYLHLQPPTTTTYAYLPAPAHQRPPHLCPRPRRSLVLDVHQITANYNARTHTSAPDCPSPPPYPPPHPTTPVPCHLAENCHHHHHHYRTLLHN